MKSQLVAKSRIFLVDDHPMMRDGLRCLLNAQPDLECCGEAGDVNTALTMIRSLRPELAIIDLSLKDGSGIDLIKDIRSLSSRIRMLVLSMYDAKIYGLRSLRAGAHGYANKQEPGEALLQAIRLILSGKTYWPSQVTDTLTLNQRITSDSEPDTVQVLSNRELEVFRLIGQGFTTGQIAKSLYLSPNTIESHREKIKTKLAISSAGELHRAAVHWMLENG